MTDTELKRLQAICEVANVDDIEDLSDGFHTFNDLYEQRMYLFAALVKTHKDKAWKSMRHEDGEMCFGGDWFIVGIDTPAGSYTYHYGIKYWDVFDCQILKTAKHWDGHTEKDVTRLLSLPSAQTDHTADISKKISNSCGHENDLISRTAAIDAMKKLYDADLEAYGCEIPEMFNCDRAIETLNALPSAQPKRKTGKWIDETFNALARVHHPYHPYKCDQCGEHSETNSNFCPNCGAMMTEVGTGR